MGLTSACLFLLLGQRPWCEACITAPEARAPPGKGCLASLSLPHAPSVQTPRAYSVLSLSCSTRKSPVPPSHRTIAQASVGGYQRGVETSGRRAPSSTEAQSQGAQGGCWLGCGLTSLLLWHCQTGPSQVGPSQLGRGSSAQACMGCRDVAQSPRGRATLRAPLRLCRWETSPSQGSPENEGSPHPPGLETQAPTELPPPVVPGCPLRQRQRLALDRWRRSSVMSR